MNLMSPEYFSALIRHGSFTAAAKALHITQQTLSAHIAALEEEFGQQLVERTSPVRLTQAGRVFLDWSRDMLVRQQRLFHDMEAVGNDRGGHLRIGIAYTRSCILMPELISRWHDRYPDVTFLLYEAANPALFAKALQGELDLLIGVFPTCPGELTLYPYYQDEILMLQPLAEGDYPLALGYPMEIAGQVGRRCNQDQQKPVLVTSDNVLTLTELCLKGQAISFCPRLILERAYGSSLQEKVHLLNLPDYARYDVQFALPPHSQGWKLVEAFMNLARDLVAGSSLPATQVSD